MVSSTDGGWWPYILMGRVETHVGALCLHCCFHGENHWKSGGAIREVGEDIKIRLCHF
jgi:hypothetical protein